VQLRQREAQQAGASTEAGRTLTQVRADALLKDLFNMRLSQSKEDAADEKGAEMAQKAGYAGSGLEGFLRTLAAANSDPAKQRAFGQLLSTHPSFDERISHLQSSSALTESSGRTLEDRFRRSVAQ